MSTVEVRSGRRRWPRLTARLRLTLLFGAVFVLAGAVLLSLNYVLVQQSFHENHDEVRAAIARRLGTSEAEVRRTLETARRNGKFPSPPSGLPRRPGLFRAVQAEITQSHLDRLLVQSSIALGVMAIVSVGLGWLVAGRVLRPVNEMTTTARRLSESNLHERIGLTGPDDELKELADTFDAMLDRLQAAFEAQRHFVADASHELRTPLSIIRAEVDVTLSAPDASIEELRTMGETVRDATERTERLIDSLLALARSDAAGRGSDRCDLAELARIAVERVTRDADERSLGLELTLQPAPVRGDRALLDRLVGNLVENAVRHNVQHGWLRVETGLTPDRTAEIVVENGGPRITNAEAAQLTRRFHRAGDARDRPRDSFGLGLAIVESVTQAMGGELRITPREGGGLRVTVSLPASVEQVVELPEPVLI
jgi:signal transduction histidine kinase